MGSVMMKYCFCSHYISTTTNTSCLNTITTSPTAPTTTARTAPTTTTTTTTTATTTTTSGATTAALMLWYCLEKNGKSGSHLSASIGIVFVVLKTESPVVT